MFDFCVAFVVRNTDRIFSDWMFPLYFVGNHVGVGVGKLPWIKEEHGIPALELMTQLKQSIDPLGIMNPGKLGTPPSQIPDYGY